MQRFIARRGAAKLCATALALAAGAVCAAPVVGPSDQTFYNAPASIPAGNNGDLIQYRQATVKLAADAPGYKAWNVMYRSTDSVGNANVVTGTVLVPSAFSLFARPIVSYAVGTHGLSQGCAPSVQLAQGNDYETANITAALKAGYVVLVTDYAGYLNGKTPTYLAGASQGKAVLDIVRAASQIPSSGVSANAKTAIWGYSQGGQTAAWAGELKASYAPNLNLVGVAAGGVPGDFPTTATYLDGSAGASFLLAGVIGLAEQYPAQIPLAQLTNPVGQAAIVTGKSQCVFEALFTFMNHSLSEYTVGNQPLSQFLAQPAINQVVTAQNLGAAKIPVPLYQYHGQADEFIPLQQAYALKKKYCAKGTNVSFDLFPSEHIATQFQAAPQALTWIADRFSGKTAASTCATTQPDPQSTANPSGGNFIVSLKQWALNASVGLKTLGQTVNMPKESTFSADADMTAKQLKNGKLAVPDFTAKLNILLPIDVKMSITPVGDATGTTDLDKNGILSIKGLQRVTIGVQTVGSLGINLPFGCKTSSPVEFPLNFSGPVSSLGAGKISFSGTTTFPSMTDCGLYGPLLSALMSGSGQTYNFNVVPPAPVKW